MRRLRAALAAIILLPLCGLAFAQISGSLGELWRRGQFDEVRAIIDANSSAGNDSRAFLEEAAEAAYEIGDYAVSAELYGKLAIESALDPDAYRDAKRLQWQSLWRAGGEDPAAPWVVAARSEVGLALSDAALTKSPRRQLALELEQLLESLLDPAFKTRSELMNDYPRSPVVLELAWQRADRLARIEDDGERIASARELLRIFPGNYWRHLMYRNWLYSAWRMRDESQLRQAAAAYLKEYESSPDSHGAVSRYYLDADIEPEAGLAAAQRSVELYETALGLDGSELAVHELALESRDDADQPAWQLPSKRQQFRDYLGSRFNLARWQIKLEQYPEALGQVLPVIAAEPFSLDEELSLAPFYVAAGQASLGRNDKKGAYRYFMGALVEGDASGRYALQAEQELGKLSNAVSASEAKSIRESFIPEELSGIPLPSFTDITIAAGLEGQSGRRIAWGDINGDGRAELLVDGSHLFWNDQAKGLVETTKGVGLAGSYTGGLFADVDNDGDLDIFSFGDNVRGDKLWRNEMARFTDVTSFAGTLGDNQRNEAASFLDYDGDGWVDLFLPVFDRAYKQGDLPPAKRLDNLFRNTGMAVFDRQSAERAGMQTALPLPCVARGCSASDIDADGTPEIYVANSLLTENLLWRRTDSGFENVARQHNLAGSSEAQRWGSSAGCDFGDLNNDGLLDLFCANTLESADTYGADHSMLLIAEAASFGLDYSEQRSQWGVTAGDSPSEPCFGDFNNDGLLDLLLTNSYGGRRTVLYLNNGRGQLVDVTFLAGLRIYDGWGAGLADFDRDGDLDFAVASPSGLRMLRNDSPQQAWLQVACRGESDSFAAIGARVTLQAGGITQVREIQSGKGSGNGNELMAHFGLGSLRGAATVTVLFPGGREVTRRLTRLNERIEVNYATVGGGSQEAESFLAPEAEADNDSETEAVLERPADGSRED